MLIDAFAGLIPDETGDLPDLIRRWPTGLTEFTAEQDSRT